GRNPPPDRSAPSGPARAVADLIQPASFRSGRAALGGIGMSHLVVCDPEEVARMIARRREMGWDSFDEMWEGVYVMSPIANDEHQAIVGGLVGIALEVVGWSGRGKVRPGVNISDRAEQW